MIWRWIAEGFIQGGALEIRLFELGGRYFSELINRNLIQLADVNVECRMGNCCIHDMVDDLICSLSSQENFVAILDEGCNLLSHLTNLRYVENLLHLRYLGLQGTYVSVLPTEIGKLQFLQTLDLRIHRSMEVPSSVVRLGHLMGLHVDREMRLSVGIGNLVSLEELRRVKVGGANAIEKEPGKLMELRVLGLSWQGGDESV
ncbi:hypothetical protein VPH35_140855 [Triticum aestivum]